ncbi:MAG: sulfurtransferase TusA family protein [Nitrospirae bacterium]|nr:sulfurtransferase TusA family protein [Nitrospirota bacterium]
MAKTTLDLKGMSCPMPIMKLAAAVKKGVSGDVFEATSDDAGFEPDILAWVKETGHPMSGIVKDGKNITVTVTKK